MKKFFIILILLTVAIMGLLPLGVSFGAEEVYTRFISSLNRTLEAKGQPPIQIKKYDRGYFKANAVLTQKQMVSSGSGNATLIPMTLVIKDTIWHFPWLMLMHFGKHHDDIVKWKGWQDFELPLIFVQNDVIELHFSQASAGSMASPPSEAVFNVADYITDKSGPSGLFYSWFPWWPRLNPNAIANNVLTVDPHLDVQWKMWFDHNINIGSSTGKSAVEIQNLSVFSNTPVAVFSRTSNALAKAEESVGFSLLSIPSPTNSGMRVTNFTHHALIDPVSEANYAEIVTGIEKLELNGVFRVDELNFKQVVEKKVDAINLKLSNSAQRLRVEPQLVPAPAPSTADKTSTLQTTTAKPAPVGAATYQPIIVNLSLMNVPFSESFLDTLSNAQAAKTDPDYMENIFKKILENKPELVINQFTFGFPEGLMEIKGKLGFADTTDITSLLHDPNRLMTLKKSLNGQLTLRLPKQRVDQIMKNRIEQILVSEMIANTPAGIKLKSMTVAERNSLLDSMSQSQLNDLIEKKVLLLAQNTNDIYTLDLVFKGGNLLVNGTVMTDQLTQISLPASLTASGVSGAADTTIPTTTGTSTPSPSH